MSGDESSAGGLEVLPPSKHATETKVATIESSIGGDTSAAMDGADGAVDLKPHSSAVDAMLTDLYQLTMAYGYWMSNRHEDDSVFDCYFRENPFKGEFTIFAGLEEVIRYVYSFGFTDKNVAALQKRFPTWKPDFWIWLRSLDTSKVRIYAVEEGQIVFPRIPLLRIEGPLAVCQLLETTVLVLVNFASLIATNAARHRLAVGPNKLLLEFGLRRAQGPDGAMSASRYAYIGGFDGTSNVKAATIFNISMSGTHAHSFVTAFISLEDLRTNQILDAKGNTVEFVDLVMKKRQLLHKGSTNQGELAAFIAYAQAFPTNFLALIDTYDTLESGVWNFLCVALALHDCGYHPQGIRLDSGDLAYLSKECRSLFNKVGDEHKVDFSKLVIVASNDLSEKVLWSLKEQGHEIDAFGVGTNLVTCKGQPALGCVYKLVQVRDKPRIKISQDVVKVTIPGRKECYRLFNAKGEPILDLMIAVGSPAPAPHKRILCRHPFDPNKRCYVTPSKVELLHQCVWDGKLTSPFPTIQQVRSKAIDWLASFRDDHKRRLNPTPYKISLSSDLFTYMHDLWLTEMPVVEFS